jgi:tetratricopeptide (TPR) repeat protein
MSRNLAFLLLSLCAGAQTNNEALAQKAVEAERRGDFPRAISVFEQLIREGEDSPELRTNLGIALFQSGDLHGGLREFRVALSKSPGLPSANLFCGLSLLKLQEPKQALTYLSKADRAQPDDVMTVSAMAQAEVASNQISSANQNFRAVTRLDPQNAQGWYGRGITDRLLAESKLKAAKQSPTSPAAQRGTNESQKLMDDFQSSVRVAMQLDPGSVRASMILGESLRIAERYDEAIREYKLATEQSPQLAAAWAGLAAAQSASGDDESALQSATRALELDPNDADTDTLLAAIYVRIGDLSKAEPFTRKALLLRPDLSSGHLVLAKIHLANHQPQKALPELQAAAMDDVDGTTHYLLATTLRQLGRPGESAVAMQKYEQLHRSHVSSVAR